MYDSNKFYKMYYSLNNHYIVEIFKYIFLYENTMNKTKFSNKSKINLKNIVNFSFKTVQYTSMITVTLIGFVL